MSTTRSSLFEIDAHGIEQFVEDVQYFWGGAAISVLDDPPSALEFLRDYVSVSRPCIIRKATSFRCTVQDLVERCPPMELIVVDVSPDGHADVLRRVKDRKDDESIHTIFVQPEQRVMYIESFHKQLLHQNSRSRNKNTDFTSSALHQDPFSRVFSVAPKVQTTGYHKNDNTDSGTDEDCLKEKNDDCVYYYSRQNDCLRQELSQFWESTSHENELPRTFDWAEEAFGTGPPQAVNLWMGNKRSVSSMHKDHYENLFYVASGEKLFTLCPPADVPFLYEQEYDSGRFQWSKDQEEWNVQLDDENDSDELQDSAASKPPPRARWIAADVTRKHSDEYLQSFPLLRYTHPIEVNVKEGELLYLPALWFHRVTQTCETVGVNYWYDMKFESPAWTFFHLLQQLKSTT